MPKQTKSGSSTSKRSSYKGKSKSGSKKTTATVKKSVPKLEAAMSAFIPKTTSQVVIRALTTKYASRMWNKIPVYAIQIGTIIGKDKAEVLKKAAAAVSNKLVFRVRPSGSNVYKIYIVPQHQPLLNTQVQKYGRAVATLKRFSDRESYRGEETSPNKLAYHKAVKKSSSDNIKRYMDGTSMKDMLSDIVYESHI